MNPTERNKQSTKNEAQMASKYMKGLTISLVIVEIEFYTKNRPLYNH